MFKALKLSKLSVILVLLSAISAMAGNVDIKGNRIITVEPEKQHLFRNPLMGWAIYSDAYNPDMEFWNKFDSIIVDEYDQPFKASDYATHLYIRWPWSAFERAEGEYAWNYDNFLKLLEKGATERGLKLAFRIYVDSRDYSTSSTPEYVRAAGAKGFVGNTKRWSPYPDDSVFQQKYEKFIKAFAERYNDPERVEYVDGFGLGKWGEGHSVIYHDNNNKENVFKWITDLYSKHFTRIPLALNYHRLIASEKEWGRAEPDSEKLLEYAFNKGYILRHDAFGMGEYYGEFEETIVQEFFPERPVIAENGWWHNNTSHWKKDPNEYNTWRDVWQQTLTDALAQHANILDLRNISETRSWFTTSFDLIEKFIAEGGYRFYPDSISLPVKVSNGSHIKIAHQWHNLGCGYCPVNIPCWNQKYKVAFGLMNADNEVIMTYVDEQTDLSKWLKGTPVAYVFEQEINNVPSGTYTWGVAIVDKTKDNISGIDISVAKNVTDSGWLKLQQVKIK